MKITQAIKMAFASICSTKLRSFLTMLGIIIGVMSVTVLVSIVQSTTNNVSDTLSQLGGNVISATVTSRRSNKITTSDLKSLENNPAIESVSPIISGSSTAKASGNSSSVTLKGITEEYEDIQNISVQKGRYILDVDNDNRLQVCLIGVSQRLIWTYRCRRRNDPNLRKKLQDHRSLRRRWIIPERLQRFSDLYSIYNSTKDHAKQHDQQFLCICNK